MLSHKYLTKDKILQVILFSLVTFGMMSMVLNFPLASTASKQIKEATDNVVDLLSWLSAGVGMCIAVVGFIQLGLAQLRSDPDSNAQAVKVVFAGIVLCLVKVFYEGLSLAMPT